MSLNRDRHDHRADDTAIELTQETARHITGSPANAGLENDKSRKYGGKCRTGN